MKIERTDRSNCRRRPTGTAAAALALVLSPGLVLADGATVHAVRLGGDAQATRLVLDLDHTVHARVVKADAQRIVVDLPTAAADVGLKGLGRGVIRAWKIESGAGGARLIIDLAQEAEPPSPFLISPSPGVDHYRLVVDLHPAVAGASAVAALPVRPPPQRRIVVIDAGHGGHDTGAQGGGLNEKDLNLAAALALQQDLERTGRYKVVMTRTSDVFVPLPERVQIARRAGADLFISLHSDSAGVNSAIHGASVYTLSDSGGARVGAVLGNHEVFTSAASADPAVGGILLDLTQRSTRNRSAEFAGLLLERIGGKVDLLPHGQRDAGYFVLLAPDVPAVLLEMGFVSSPDDQFRLSDPTERAALMDEVAGSIDAYFAAGTRLAHR